MPEDARALLEDDVERRRGVDPEGERRPLGGEPGRADEQAARPGAERRVWGASESLPWPERLVGAPELQAAVLRAGADLGRDTLVLPVEPDVGRCLEGISDRVLRLEVRPWERAQIEACLRDVVEAGSAADHELARWAKAIDEASGGWPARVIRAIEAFARSGGEDPDRAAIERALMAEGGARLDPELARRVLDRHWGFAVELPASLVSDDQRPLAGALAAARSSLGEATVLGLARATLDQVRREGKLAPTSLALDADDAEAIERCELEPLAELASDLVAWLERGGIVRVGPRLRLRALRDLIRRGQAERALAMLGQIRATGAPSPAESLEGVRALEQLGRANEALAAVELLLERATSFDRDRALGLRWRALVDVGQAATAREEAEAWAEVTRSHPRERRSWRRAVAWLWGGLAQLYSGGDAVSWLAEALVECEGEHGPATARAVASVRARVFQLEANLAHLEGDAARASDRYRAAAEAFGRAGESVGRLVAEGSLAALAVHAGAFEEALIRGRRTLRAFLARAHVQTLPAAGFNLTRALVSVGALDEGRRLHALTREVVLVSGEASPLARARLRRTELELDLAVANFSGRSRARRDRLRRELGRGLSECAEQLEGAGAINEAADALSLAATCLRVSGDPLGARAKLDAAAKLAEVGEPELGVRVGLALETLAQARPGELAQASGLLATVPGPQELWARGEQLLALTYDRTLLCALHAHGSVGDASTSSVARRLLIHLEDIMAKVPPLDRRALRQSLLSEAGEAAPLRELVRELELASAEAERQPVAAANQAVEAEPAEGAAQVQRAEPRSEAETARTQQLLRLFRRLARHEHLDELLEQIVEAMMELTEAERGVVCVGRGDERIEVAREFAAEGEGVTFSRSIIERVMREGEPVLSVDAASDDRFDGSRSISHLNLRSVLAVPLIFRGEVLGAAYVDHRLRRGNFDAADLSSMEDFAALAALAVTQARALAAVRSQATELERQKAELAELLEQREADLVNLREEVRADPERRIYRGMVGSSKAMQRVFRLVDRLADSDVPVVIYGESGTGKELVARAIHAGGVRADQPFVAENCGAIPETLLESVLFGHARGAFTGAQSARPGLFEAANKGTIFLDEIGETSAAMQTKLLRVLQEGEIRRLGETKARKVDVRVIAASNRDLEAMVERGEFRQDLFYRINVVKLSLPPLRERREDVPALVDHFLERHRRGGEGLQISASALRKLTRYPWPGNVRELENEVQRWVALCEDRVMPEDLSPAIEGSLAEVDDPDDLELRPRVDRLERDLIARAMKRTGGNQTQAAQLLGLSRYGLQKKLKRMQAEE